MGNMSNLKPVGTSIIFLNPNNQVLLLLRDDIPDIKYHGMWDIPGGNAEEGETPEECITREIQEEFGLAIKDFELFEVREFSDRLEYTYWQRADFDIDRINLTEGQRLSWFSERMAKSTLLAFQFNETIISFYGKKPFLICS